MRLGAAIWLLPIGIGALLAIVLVSALDPGGGEDDPGGPSRTALPPTDRYRTVEAGDLRVPPATAPLRVPVRGPVLAAYGTLYGGLHDGIDISAPTGAPIRAPAAGAVILAGTTSAYGRYTCLLHRFAKRFKGRRSLVSCYGNQSRIEVGPGDRIRAGQTIGRVGCSGPCLRPHLHFQVRFGATAAAPTADPAPFLPAGLASIAGGRPLERIPR